jgi:hypothetical protein
MAEQTYGEGKGSSGKPWSRRLKDLIVTRGIRFVCGSSAALSPNVANDVPLMSAALRMALLRGLRICGVRRITGTSPFGHKFVCHTGDLAEYPYYHRRACEKELALCSAWLDGSDRPNIFDLGANVGFFATQLAQLLRSQRPRIFAFEPVPYTYAKLRESIEILGLQARSAFWEPHRILGWVIKARGLRQSAWIISARSKAAFRLAQFQSPCRSENPKERLVRTCRRPV